MKFRQECYLIAALFTELRVALEVTSGPSRPQRDTAAVMMALGISSVTSLARRVYLNPCAFQSDPDAFCLDSSFARPD